MHVTRVSVLVNGGKSVAGQWRSGKSCNPGSCACPKGPNVAGDFLGGQQGLTWLFLNHQFW